ncbi:DUF5709 domain-containing protein [Pseudokineococcus basanitobsidens]|uniref:DUF5709 domain-containing protein n=1 Tax=Pseudokineococcus basanitobsidens TaxID=1926649 RepID=A0ABU8RH70_9ACTN
MSTTPDESSAVGDDVYQPDAGGVDDAAVEPDVRDYDDENSLGTPTQDQTLDQGYSPPEKPRELGRTGTTLEEQREGESLDERLSEEVPDPAMAVPDPLAEDPGPVREDAEMSTGDADDTAEAALPGTEADLDTDGELLDDQVGDVRAGRLVDPSGGIGPDTEKDEVARDAGLAGGAAGAEEAAVHVVDDQDAPA